MNYRKMELLAPAGSWDSLVAAVEAGADAVYLAGQSFGARAYAGNFDREQLAAAVRFAHLRDVAVHVTVNTIVTDSERDDCADYLRYLAEIGADAIIVQDLGVAALARSVAPRLVLHASTQMTITNLAAVRELADISFARVVLARELSLENIAYIAAHSPIEIEVFAHGALCVCYSGQCLMSSLIGARSGNRGRCAQPCRLPYQLVLADGSPAPLKEKAGEYLLSPRDLKTTEILSALRAAGVASLKIEGRMKRPEYVATVVRAYRHALDNLADFSAANAVSSRPPFKSGTKCRQEVFDNPPAADCADIDDERDLAQVFNRDFTTAYLLGRPGRNLMSDLRPNNRGVLIGRVTMARSLADGGQEIRLKLSETANRGDELDFWVKVGGRATARLDDFADENGKSRASAAAGETIIFRVAAQKAKIREHDRAFRVFDAALTEKAREYFTAGAPLKKLPVKMAAYFGLNEKPQLKISLLDDAAMSVEVAADYIINAAEKRPLTAEMARKQILRLGATVYEVRRDEDLSLDIAPNIMLPLSVLNDLRRMGTDALDAARLARWRERQREIAEKILFRPSDEQAPPYRRYAAAPPLERGARGKRLSLDGSHRQPQETNNLPRLYASTDTLDGVKAAISGGADAVIFGGDSYRHELIAAAQYAKAAEMARRAGRGIFFNTPRIIGEENLAALEKIWREWAAIAPAAIYVHNIGSLRLVREMTGGDIPLRNDFSLIAYSRLAVAALATIGISQITLSPELNLGQIAAIAKESPLPLECIVHGQLELMVSEYCPIGCFAGAKAPQIKNRYSAAAKKGQMDEKHSDESAFLDNQEKTADSAANPPPALGVPNCDMMCRRASYGLKDRKGEIFPIVCDQFCRTHILNGKNLSMLPNLDALTNIGLSALRIEAKYLPPAAIGETVAAYRRALDGESIATSPLADGDAVTRGHFYRGVM